MKNFKEFAIPTVALFLICLVATTLLAVTNKVTAPKIAELSAQTEVETRQKVLPAATQFGETQEMKGGSGTYAVGKDASGNEVGYVFVTVSKGYGGDVKIMTGVDKNSASGNEIQALTGATITSKAVTAAVNEALSYYDSNLKGAE